MRPNPTFEPQVRAQLLPEGDHNAKVKCILDEAKYAARRKAKLLRLSFWYNFRGLKFY